MNPLTCSSLLRPARAVWRNCESTPHTDLLKPAPGIPLYLQIQESSCDSETKTQNKQMKEQYYPPVIIGLMWLQQLIRDESQHFKQCTGSRFGFAANLLPHAAFRSGRWPVSDTSKQAGKNAVCAAK